MQTFIKRITYILVFIYTGCFAQTVIYHNASEFLLLGKVPDAENYSRLPKKAQKTVRNEVWDISRNSTGISIRFTSNSSLIKLKWTTEGKANPVFHLSPIVQKGFDLYAYVNKKWQFVNIAKPATQGECILIDGMTPTTREYLLNLPMFESIASLEIGIDDKSYIVKPTDAIIDTSNPVVFYGTSITQGASASRPGLTYTSLLQKNLNKEVINLGFSGNGRFEKTVAQFFMPAKPSVVVLDCTPNSSPDSIRKNLPELIEYIDSINPDVPIILIESLMRDFAPFKKDPNAAFSEEYIEKQNNTLKEVYENKKKKHKKIYYIKYEELLGTDHETTIDGIHFNDIGHYRAYELLYKKLKPFIKKK